MANLDIHAKTVADLSGLVINGPRVSLSPVSHAEASDIYTEFNENITRYMIPKPVANIEQAYEFIDQSIVKLQQQNDLILSIFARQKKEFLGICGLHACKDDGFPILGIWIKESAHGKKLGREAIQLLVAWVKNNVNTRKLIYPVDRRNTASCKIAESLGGQIIRQGLLKSMSGEVLQEVVYQIDV